MSQAAVAAVRIRLVGAPSWHGPRLPGAPLGPRDAALFALLALEGAMARDRLAAWLWPEVPQKNANLSLRQRLFRLRQTSGHPLFRAAAMLELLPDVAVDAARPDPDAEGELLGGYDYGHSEALEAWVRRAREDLLRRQLDGLAGQAARLEASGALAEAIVLCERIVVREPAFEHAWRRLMRLHYLRGDRAAAVAAFERFEDQVCRERGTRPAAETLALLETIERAQAVAPPSLRSPLPAVLQRPPLLVGRRGALDVLAAAWADGRAVLVRGEGGLGKTRLLEELVASRRGVLVSRARPGDASMPYATVATALAQLIDRFVPALAPAARSELARLLPALGPAPAVPAQQARLWHEVQSLLEQAQRQGLQALLLDDLHWADAASLDLLRWLMAAPALAALRWAFAARPGEGEPAAAALAQWTGDSLRVEPLVLAALSEPEVHELLQSLALPQVPPEIGPALYRHAGGHPFFTLETLKAMLLAGGSGVPPRLPLPAAASALVLRRVAGLGAAARELLQLLALAGAELRLDLAVHVLQRPYAELADTWSELHAAQLVQGGGVAHDLVREVVVAELPAVARRALHCALAEALRGQGGAPPQQLAAHWWQGEAWAEASLAWEQAALQARRSGRLTEYEALLERSGEAAASAGDDDRRFELVSSALAARMLRQGPAEALRGIDEWLPRAHTGTQQAALRVLRTQALLNGARFSEALTEAALALAAADPGSGVHFDALTLHGRALALAGSADGAVAALQRACASEVAQRDPAKAVHAYAALSHALFAAHRLGDAVAAQRRALELAEQGADAAEMAQCAGNLAVLAARAGETRLAHDAARIARERNAALGIVDLHDLLAAIVLARSAAVLGRAAEGVALLQALAAPWDRANLGVPQVMALAALAGLHQWLGRSGEALAVLPDDDPRWPALPRAVAALARWKLLRERGDPLAPAVAVLEAVARDAPALRQDATLYRDWSALDDAEAAVPALQAMAARLREAGAPGTARSLQLAQAERLAESDPQAAARLARELLPHLPEGLGPQVHPPQAWSRLARLLDRAGDAAGAAGCRDAAARWLRRAQLTS